jgi:hypothetical protein
VIFAKAIEISEAVIPDIRHLGIARRGVPAISFDDILISLALKVASLPMLPDMASDIAYVMFDIEEVVLEQLAVFCLRSVIISRSQSRVDAFLWIGFIVLEKNHVHQYDQENTRDN